MVVSPFLTALWASFQRIKAATMRSGCTWHSLVITATTYREKGMNNGFSSRKDPLRTNPARKEAKQLKKATVRFRYNRPHVLHGSQEHNARDRGTPRPSLNDLMWPGQVGVRLSLFRVDRTPTHNTHLCRYRYIHNTNRVNDKISNAKEEKTSITVSIAKLDGGITQRATGKPAGSIFIFNFALADFAMANELELMATYII